MSRSNFLTLPSSVVAVAGLTTIGWSIVPCVAEASETAPTVMIRPHRHMRSRQRLGLLVAEGTSLAALGTSCLRLAMHSSVVYLDFYNRIIPVLRGSVSCYVTQVRRIFKHRDVTSHVESDLEGDTFRFEFTIDGNTTRGKTRTKLIGLAKRRVTILINRKLLERKRQLQ